MASKKTILVTGAGGQLGSEFRDLEKTFPEFNFLFEERKTLQITDPTGINEYFSQNNIDVCVNCAAYTAVDKAEQEKEKAEEVNYKGVGFLAKACKDHGAVFIHISTDYVFDGTATTPYFPEHLTNPVNYYGSTKLKGEQEAMNVNPKTIIIRTAWVYSTYGNNFVKTMMRLMGERDSISVVNDQHGSPTFAGDLAVAIMHIIYTDNFLPGIYHYTNEGATTWYGFAKEIADIIKTNCTVLPITTADFPTPAARPAYSVLDTQKLKSAFGLSIPKWQDSLKKCISQFSAE